MLLGGSSSLDPWLLRHLRFDELGLQSFYKYHVRNAGGVPTSDKIPVHFILTSDEVAADAPAEGLETEAETKLPEVETLNSIPTHLLAAIYGSALPFTSADEHLVVPLMHERVPCGEVWRIAQSSFLRDLPRPHLSVLQAMLLCLHRTKEDPKQHAVADTAALWPLMGTMVGLAHNLGLHLECRIMGIPAYEKRLRRRLWWAVYIEDKFYSLLAGRPPYIQQGEWDVGQLDSADFVLRSDVEHPLPWHRMPFVHMANLALIADSLQRSLYSLQSCQKLAEDLTGSIQAARTAFDALNTWRANIPGLEHILEETDVTRPALDNDPSSVQFACLILVTYVWRAVLRPTVRSQPPPPILDVDQDEQPAEWTSLSLRDFGWDMADLGDISLDLGDGGVEVHDDATVIELYRGALAWAAGQMPRSRLSFVAASSFIAMLVVQAPCPESARRGKDMLDNWRRLLRDQSRAFPMLGLSFSQLSEFYRVGLSTAFCLPLHVQEAVEGGGNG
ncbi:putative transcriptional regulatory protein [Colletotrichum shisoi]|uniref:Putative transcriptional regulatory protein n=1 Tax=Colletotrichum shisoi TaxID=2078593 RepID=A0A5Q4BG07_9PEZI|nr:putative transcriptional regulatory protein [Colletotrichum shisoi]